jgi:glycosyltransferase involved in cell wall biosynthesis
MRLVVVSHKVCWHSDQSPSGFASDGGFPIQIRAISELFDETTLVVPCSPERHPAGELPLEGNNLSVVPLSIPGGTGLTRKLRLPAWLARNGPVLIRHVRRANAVHAPIPGDVGTLGLLVALALRKPLFVRHCGNWFEPRTAAEHFWKWLMEHYAGGQNVMLATGGAVHPPSRRNPHIRWIFSTSVTEDELRHYGAAQRTFPAALRLITCCRQERKKGTGAVIASLPMLADDFPTVHLDVVGEGPDLAHFKAQALATGVAHRVTFHGRVNHGEVLALLERADVFCFPTSASEGFPKAVVEAMACGLPIVATRVSALPSLLEHGAGVLIDRTDPESIAAAVRSCIGDAAHYRTMAQASIDTARALSLEKWQETIGSLLSLRWGPLRAHV